MNNIFILIKANITNSWGINKVLKSKSKAAKIKLGLIGIAIVYVFCALVFSAFLMNYELSKILEQLNLLELLISSSIITITLILIIMNSIRIPGYLFSFKDYDLLMSLPLKSRVILSSKMIFIYLTNLMISALVGIPPLIVYGVKTSGGLLYYCLVIIAVFFIPLIPIAISAFFAYYLGRISSKFKSSNVIMLIGSFIVFIAIMVGSSLVGQINTEVVKNTIPTVTLLNDILFWSKLFIVALTDSNILYLMAFVLVSLIIFSIFIAIYSNGFKSINSKLSEKYKVTNYKMSELKSSTLMKALYIKELKFYFSSYIYVMNTAIGVLMMTIFSLGIAIFGRDTISKVLEIPMAEAYIVPITIAIFAFCINLTSTTASSISLEGKNLWIIKSLPIKITNILWSKILVNLTLTIPALIINTIIIAVTFKMDVVTIIAVFSVSLLYCLISPVIGILINLYLPKLEWNTHVAVVKQSASVLVNMLVGFLIIVLPGAIFAIINPSNSNLYFGALSIVLLIIIAVLIKIVNYTGVRKFKEL